MSAEKANTKRDGTLSDAVLSVLNHPDTPDELFSAIKDELLDMAQHVHLDLCSTEILPFALPMILERLEQRKGAQDGKA